MSESKPAIRPLPAPTKTEVLQSRRLKQQSAMSLQSVRSSAERWRNAGLVSGALAIAGTIVGGSELLVNLPSAARGIVIAIAGLAFAAGFAAIGLAIRASIGWPRFVAADSPAALERWERNETSTVVRCLQWSMWLTATAAILGVSGVGVSATLSAVPTYLSISTDRITVCGILESSTDETYVLDVGNALVEVRIVDIEQMSTATKCA